MLPVTTSVRRWPILMESDKCRSALRQKAEAAINLEPVPSVGYKGRRLSPRCRRVIAVVNTAITASSTYQLSHHQKPRTIKV